MGLHARVLSAKTALLTWMDSTLPKNQLIPDRGHRYYIVRYKTATSSQDNNFRYKNCSDLNIMIDDLRPSTEYVFVVKVVKGRSRSGWSMQARNTTRDAAPGSPPRDLLIRSISDGDSNGKSVKLSWRPPKAPNGPINGYIIHYSADRRADDRDWFVEAVMGPQTEAKISGLRDNTRYYFKMSARNAVGYGPVGALAAFATPRNNNNHNNNSPNDRQQQQQQEVSPVVLYAVAGVGAGIIIAVIIGAAVLVHRCVNHRLNTVKSRFNECVLIP